MRIHSFLVYSCENPKTTRWYPLITSTYFRDINDSPTHNLSEAEIVAALSNPEGLLWVSLEQSSHDEIHHILKDIFQFHPLAVEDCQSSGYQTPKIDDFGSYIFLILHAVPNGLSEIDNGHIRELNLFVGENFLVTCYQSPTMPPIDAVKIRIQRDERLIKNGPDFLCHAIIDVLVDDYIPVLDQLDDELEYLEDRVLAKPSPDVLAKLLDIKHNLMTLRRILSPQREVVNRLSRDEFPMIDKHSQIYFRDIYDHLVRLQDLSETLRDIVSGVLDIYLNSTSLRLNEIMKALTVVSTIFLPLSFIAGVYGMNFHFMPELTWRYGYLLIWIVFVSVFVGMLTWFKRRNWF